MGDGRYPHMALKPVLATWGVFVTLGAAARAGAAATGRGFRGEVIPGIGGFALMTVALGTPLGLVAGLVTLAFASAMTGCLSLLPDRAGLASLIAIAAAVGLPPALGFGARIVGIESTFEAGDFFRFIGVAGAIARGIWVVAAPRATGPPPPRGRPAPA